jgi:hypothetical protein
MKGVNSGTLGLIFLADFLEAVKKSTISRVDCPFFSTTPALARHPSSHEKGQRLGGSGGGSLASCNHHPIWW